VTEWGLANVIDELREAREPKMGGEPEEPRSADIGDNGRPARSRLSDRLEPAG
jgi:hypothetical protein